MTTIEMLAAMIAS